MKKPNVSSCGTDFDPSKIGMQPVRRVQECTVRRVQESVELRARLNDHVRTFCFWRQSAWAGQCCGSSCGATMEVCTSRSPLAVAIPVAVPSP